MSRGNGVKILIFLLTAVLLLTLATSGLAASFLGENDLYKHTPEEMLSSILNDITYSSAYFAAFRYEATQRGIEEEVALEIARNSGVYLGYFGYQGLASGWVQYALYSAEGELLETNYSEEYIGGLYTCSHHVSSWIPRLRFISRNDPGNEAATTMHIDDPESLTGTAPINETLERREKMFLENGPDGAGYYVVDYYDGPDYTVEFRVSQVNMKEYYGAAYWNTAELLYAHRKLVLVTVPSSFVLFVAGLVYLCWAAGWDPKSQSVKPMFLHRMPYDLCLTLAGGIGVLALAGGVQLLEWSLEVGEALVLVTGAMCLLITAVMALYLIYAFAAQVKIRGYWWRNLLIGRLLGWLAKGIGWLVRAIGAVGRVIPVMWRWLLIAVVLLFFYSLTVVWMDYGSPLPWFFMAIVCAGTVLYGAYCVATLLRGMKKMAKGDLKHQIPTGHLVGCFRECAQNLNKVADAAMVAAEKQTRSERMKTELITNVSHDIKTPLTSIINFVDLLQKPHTQEEETQYLEVLGRQSQRLKRLVEDLMDLSKANTGNMVVDLAEMDAVEVVNQALGEFADKLEAAQLTPVFHEPEAPAQILADGRLAWRVLSNLLTNVVKYALPGTRVYVDVIPLEGKVLISLKNISREQLAVNAEELMERFVRGDASRNTDGSGLGLNIARSLMEVQHGQLQLLVDGDLFKVTLLFPSL